MKKIIILHAWYDSPDSCWYNQLKDSLVKRGYEVMIPDLAELRKDQPKLEIILSQLEEQFQFDENTSLIGHSLGCLVSLRLAEKYRLDKLTLVAGWDFNDLTEGHRYFWEKPIDHSLIMNHVKEMIIVHSDNDPYITSSQAEDMSKRFNAAFLLIPQAGHFTKRDSINDLDKLLNYF